MSLRSKKHHAVSTAAISLPQVEDASTLTSISHFSPNADLFAFLSLAVDKHRLRIFDATTGNALLEHTVDAARVTSLCWISLDLTSDGTRNDPSPAKKRKKTSGLVSTTPTKTQLVCLGLSDGSLALYSPAHGRVLRTISHPSSLTAVLAASSSNHPSHVWSSSTDGIVRLWNASRNELLGSWKTEGSTPYSSLAFCPAHSEETEAELLVANHSIRLISFSTSPSSTSEPGKLEEGISFTGHASVVKWLHWDNLQPSRFISIAEMDRVVNVWCVPDPPSKKGILVANVPLDSVARHASLLSGNVSTLLTISASGKLTLFKLPPSTPSSKVVTLSPSSIIHASARKREEMAHIIAATFVPHENGQLRIAHLVGGVKPVFEVVRYLDDAGGFISHVSLSKETSLELLATADRDSNISHKRYVEAPNLAIRSGFELDQAHDLIDISGKGVDGDLDVDLAELSLGQRLTAQSGGADLYVAHSDMSSTSETEEAPPSKHSAARRRRNTRSGKKNGEDHLPIPAHSLARTLVQALHSADTRLLETCLLHSDELLVMNTVRRLPPQLAVPLLTACVERLGRGPRANTAKGGGGGASAQRGTGLIRWIKAVLVVHTAHLMTIPDLVMRLSSLYATLTSRLALREPLLALSGRLDLVLSQIELRASAGPSPLAPETTATRQKRTNHNPVKYVEGDSDSKDDDEGETDEMEVEQGEGTASIEDVELGADSASEEGGDSGSEEEDFDSEDEGSEEGPHSNGFIDDEAEEGSEEEDDDSEE